MEEIHESLVDQDLATKSDPLDRLIDDIDSSEVPDLPRTSIHSAYRALEDLPKSDFRKRGDAVQVPKAPRSQVRRPGTNKVRDAKTSDRTTRGSEKQDLRGDGQAQAYSNIDQSGLLKGTSVGIARGIEESVAQADDRQRILDQIMPFLSRARDFADTFSDDYRAEVFRIAADALLRGRPQQPVQRSIEIPGDGNPAAFSKGTRGTAIGDNLVPSVRPRPAPNAPNSPLEKLARKLAVELEDVERAVVIREDGAITILGHVDGYTKKDLQTRYGLIYCFIKEVALAEPLIDVEELRRQCMDHACYDPGNFITNYKKDSKAGLIREDGSKGARSRRYRLTKRGLDMAAVILREMVTQ